MPNIPKLPNKEELEYIDSNISYFPKSGVLADKKQQGWTHLKGYLYLRVLGRAIKQHHIAWYKFYNEWPNLQLDHIDENKSNNSILNLRLVTDHQNRWNISSFKNNHLGEKCIRELKQGIRRFIVRINRFGKITSKGFPSLQEAKEFRDEFVKQFQ